MVKHKIATGLIHWYLKTFGYVAITMPWYTIYYINESAMFSPKLRLERKIYD